MTEIDKLTRKIDNNPFSPWLYVDRGIAYLRQSYCNEAIDDFNRAISLDPNVSDFYIERGRLLASIGEMSDAKRDFDYAIRLDPLMGEAYFARAKWSHQNKQHESAAIDINEAISLEPNVPIYHHLKAMIFSDFGYPSISLKAITRTIELDPNRWKAIEFRFNLYIYDLVSSGIATVWADSERSIQIRGDKSVSFFGRGLMYFADGQWEKASSNFSATHANKCITWDHARSVAFLLLSNQQLGISASQTPEVSDVLTSMENQCDGHAIDYWPTQAVAMLANKLDADIMIKSINDGFAIDERETRICLFEAYLFCILNNYFKNQDISIYFREIKKYRNDCLIGFYHKILAGVMSDSLSKKGE